MSAPLINGISYAFTNLTLVLFGTPVVGVTNVKITAKQNKTNLNGGLGGLPTSRGFGNEEFEASITMRLEDLIPIINASTDGKIYKIPAFDYTIVYSTDNISFFTINVRAAEFLEMNLDTTSGDMDTPIELPLIVGDIQFS